jgi:hypothetical protein
MMDRLTPLKSSDGRRGKSEAKIEDLLVSYKKESKVGAGADSEVPIGTSGGEGRREGKL